MKGTRLYYVEDEQSLGKIVSDTLVSQGYEVEWESDGAKVISSIEKYRPEICILDIMLPGIDGYSLCRTIRGMFPGLPVIFLTAKTDVQDLISGFEAGGTDYIRKPFRIEELIARIENQVRLRSGNNTLHESVKVAAIGRLTLDQTGHRLQSDTTTICLSNREMQLLKMLLANRNRVTQRKDLLLAIWGDDSYFNSRTLDVYIRKLRKYFSTEPGVRIITLKGNGYLFIVQ